MSNRLMISIQLPIDPTDQEYAAVLDFLKVHAGDQKPVTPSEVVVAQNTTPAPQEDATTSPQFDARGIPHDERIHSGSRSFKNDGTWTCRKGADKNLIAQLEAQYLAAASTPVTEPSAPAPSLPAPGGVVAPPSLPLPATTKTKYQTLVEFIGRNPPLEPALVEAYVKHVGVASGQLADLAANEALAEQLQGLLTSALTDNGIQVL